MTKTINISHAKAQLSRLVEEVRQGEELVITKRGKPIARVIPVAKRYRKPGSAIDQLFLAKNIDAPLPKRVLRAFGQ